MGAGAVRRTVGGAVPRHGDPAPDFRTTPKTFAVPLVASIASTADSTPAGGQPVLGTRPVLFRFAARERTEIRGEVMVTTWTARRLAWSVGIVSIALMVASLVLFLIDHTTRARCPRAQARGPCWARSTSP